MKKSIQLRDRAKAKQAMAKQAMAKRYWKAKSERNLANRIRWRSAIKYRSDDYLSAIQSKAPQPERIMSIGGCYWCSNR